MIFPAQTTLLPFLLLIGSTIASTKISDARSYIGKNPAHMLPNLYRREYSQEQVDKLDEYTTESSECSKKCETFDGWKSYYVPLCSVTYETQDLSEEERLENMKNSFSCSCADRKSVEQGFSCIIRECAGNSTELSRYLNGQYSWCMLYADIVYPKPEVFLNELCLLDDIPEGSVPTDVPIMKELWPDYTFAEEWPDQTATTSLPTGTDMDIEQMLESGTDADIDTDPSFTCTPKSTGTRAVSGRGRMMGMTAIVAAVVGVTVFL